MALTTEELETILRLDPVLDFCGVTAYDRIPTRVYRYPCGFVANTDPSDKKGEHWISLYFNEQRECQYLCALGTEPYGKLRAFATANSHVVFYNKRTLQNVVGPMCGYYSAYHLLQASRGKTLEQIINAFDEADPVKNDDKVQSYLHQYVNRFS